MKPTVARRSPLHSDSTRRSRGLLRRGAMLLVLVALVSSACSGDEGADGAASSTTLDARGFASLRGTLDGGGSSFQNAWQQAVKGELAKVAPKFTVNYTKSGTGQGKQDLANQIIDYAGIDSVVRAGDEDGFKGGALLYFPVVAAPITVTYNLKGVSDLKLDANVIAGMFAGTIGTWADKRIAALNPGVKLPSVEVVAVHRSDRSGTTANFTRYLTRAAPAVWTLGTGDDLKAWPTATGAEKNSGVASILASTRGSIGYVDLVDAVAAQEKSPALGLASIRNRDGKFVSPKVPGATAALEGVTVADDLTFDPIDARGDAVYPITAPTWVLTYSRYDDAATVDRLRGWLRFALTTGQQTAGINGYARLPDALAARALKQVDSITAGG